MYKCIKSSAVRNDGAGRRRFVRSDGRFQQPAMMMAACISSSCSKSCVSRLGQTADQLNAIDGIYHYASVSLARACGRHTGGVSSSFHSRGYGNVSCHPADIFSLTFLKNMEYFVDIKRTICFLLRNQTVFGLFYSVFSFSCYHSSPPVFF